jgi:D-arabinose 1-dehydrogenase-like Zn-dependent alcohol dehydrogenase
MRMIQVSGYAAQQAKAPLTPHSFTRREPRDYDIVMDIEYCGTCHTDIREVAGARCSISLIIKLPLIPQDAETHLQSKSVLCNRKC